MIGIQHPRPEGHGRIRHHLRGHGVGQVHGQKGIVDILQRFHLRGVFSITTNVHLCIAKTQHIAVALSPGMKKVPVLPLMNKVVGRNSLHPDTSNFYHIAVLHDRTALDFFRTEFREHDLCLLCP